MGRITLKEMIENPLTEEELKEIKEAAKRPIVYDEDCPKLTKEQLSHFRRVHDRNQSLRRKEVLSLRVYPTTVLKAKALGPGYTNICARLLDLALDDPELIKKCL